MIGFQWNRNWLKLFVYRMGTMRDKRNFRRGFGMSQLHFVKQGTGPVVVLSHARGCDLSMWDEVADLLAGKYTVLRYDHRGHGHSSVPVGPYTLDAFVDDAAALIEEHARMPVHFVGLSLGGLVGQSLAVRYPQWVRSLVVANAASQLNVDTREMWAERAQQVRHYGMQGVADRMLRRWFTSAFLASDAGHAKAAQVLAVFNRTPVEAYAASCEAMAQLSYVGDNRRIACPTLVIAGVHDVATPLPQSEAVVLGISGAQLQTLDAALMSAVERPQEFAQLLANFIRKV